MIYAVPTSPSPIHVFLDERDMTSGLCPLAEALVTNVTLDGKVPWLLPPACHVCQKECMQLIEEAGLAGNQL